MKKITLFALVFMFLSTVFGQTLKKGEKLIDKNDFDGAEVYFKKYLTEDENDPLSNFGMGLIYYDSANSKRELFTALNYVNIAKTSYLKLDEPGKSKIGADLNESIINDLFKLIDDELFNNISEKNDSSAYSSFVAKCPFSNHYSQAVMLYNDMVFKEITSINSIDAYNYYLANFTDSVNRAKALKSINHLVFEQVKDSNNIELYQNFINDNPDADEIAEAQEYILSIRYSLVEDTNTVEAYNRFISDYPDSKQVQKALIARNQLAFDQAMKLNSIESYESFIKTYPDAKQCSTAKSYIEELNKWTCIPGMKVGGIVYNSSLEELSVIYEVENLIYDSLLIDGQLYYGTCLYPSESNQRLFIIWKNKKELKYPDRIVILGSKWQTHKGVKIGSTLDDLTLINGKEFDLSGFRRKGEGTVISWKGGELGVLHILGKNFFLQLSYNESKFFNIPEEGLLTLTNSDFVSSDNEYLKNIDLKVSRMEILFPE